MSGYPSLEKFENHQSDWDKYIEAVYDIFKKDFVYSTPIWKPDNAQVRVNSTPMSQQKEFTFWHITSTGKVEEERVPDFKRCERIRYPKFLITNYPGQLVYAWEKDVKRSNGGREKRIHISNNDFSYLVVLSANKSSKRTLITAYFVEKVYQRKKLEKDHKKFKLK